LSTALPPTSLTNSKNLTSAGADQRARRVLVKVEGEQLLVGVANAARIVDDQHAIFHAVELLRQVQ
jgi:flagellar biogenesis protein FliO